MRVADYIVNWFYEKGIDTIFTVSGGGSIVLCDAMQVHEKMKYVCCHHEQAVAFAAEGYARAKRTFGVAIVTTGPGGTNCLTGVSSAWIDSVPVIFISGQVFASQTIQDSGTRQIGVQEINIVDLVKKNTKWSTMLLDPNDIRKTLEKAHFISTSGRPGPVWIDIPADVQGVQVNSDQLKGYKFNHNYTGIFENNDKMKLLIQKLVNSKRPIIHVGQGVKISKSMRVLLDYINKHKIPISTTWNATDVIDYDNKYFIGRPGAFAERGANFNIQNCDFYLSIGSRLPFMVTGYNSSDFARNAYKVMVDIDENELNAKKHFMDLLICSDGLEFINELAYLTPDSFEVQDEWTNNCQKLRKKYPILTEEAKNEKNWVNSYYFTSQLSDKIHGHTNVVTDMGLSFVGTHQTIKTKIGQNIFTNSGHAPMGWGLPASIGAFFAKKDYQTISLNGEGGFMMNIQELATVMHHNLDIKIFIYNNGGYQTIKQTQQLGFDGRLMGCDESSGISFPAFSKIAEANKILYKCIRNHKELDDQLSNILSISGPVIIEIMIDPEQPQIPKAVNKRLPNGKSQASDFEDLYPFLPHKELKENLLE
jgi:acetolactate synthase-1/2/3 large subunit